MDKINLVCIVIVLCFLCIIVAYQYGMLAVSDVNDNKVIVNDTTYNKVVLDSIEYNIVKKDTIIYKLKVRMRDDVEKAVVLGDSASVELFKELVESK